MAGAIHHHRYHRVADGEACPGAGADFVDDARDVHARDVGRWILAQGFRSGAFAQVSVCRVDGRSMHTYAHLAGCGMRLWQVDHLQHLGPAELENADTSHDDLPFFLRPAGRGARDRRAVCVVLLGPYMHAKREVVNHSAGRITAGSR